tara:strand:- start:818 stop:964 length:147 start_codon:yes stop_codon:yes gene_type:complete
MSGSIEQVLQPDGTYKWEVKEPKKEADETPAPKAKKTVKKKTETKSAE